MNFNAGNFGESLKYSFQQFSKQEAEAREHSRQLLLRLDRFEGKALELGSRTKKALQIKNHYERILMHQHPLVWSHIQRGLIHNVGEMETPAGVPSDAFTIRPTREMAINTSLSSSPSDQNSLHEGVWPQSPSPCPDQTSVPLHKGDTARRSEIETCKVEKDIPQIGALCIRNDNQVSEGRNTPVRFPYSEEAKLGTDVQLTDLQNLLDLQETESIRRQYSEREVKDNHQALNQERPPSLKHTQDQEIQKSAVVPSSTGRDLSASLSKMPFADEDSFERHQETPQHPDVPSRDSKVQKSFHLDSESECADDLISGPSIGRNPEGDDSDSFWN